MKLNLDIKLNFIYFFLLALCLYGCSKQNINNHLGIEEKAEILADCNTIYSTDELFIQDIDVKNGRIALKCVNDKLAFVFLNKECNKIENTILNGAGPNDVLSGALMKSAVTRNDSCFKIADVTAGKILTVNLDPSYAVSTSDNKDIIYLADLCYSDSMFIGHNSPELFTIGEPNGKRIHVPYYLSMSDDLMKDFEQNYDMIMRHKVALNREKDRILAFSSFFDAVAAYTTDGKQIMTNRMSNDVSEECRLFKDAGTYWLHSNPYATEDNCYVKLTKVENKEKTNSYLLKYNWDGDISKVYKLPKDVTGAFAIENEKLYCIVSDTQGNREIYYVVAYPLI